jgi:hypothetical protein
LSWSFEKIDEKKRTDMMKLTKSALRKMISEELKSNFGDQKDVEDIEKPEEFDADELADSIEKPIDWMKALKIEESRLLRRLARINDEKKAIKRKLMRS